jgi:hypothetical protein
VIVAHGGSLGSERVKGLLFDLARDSVDGLGRPVDVGTGGLGCGGAGGERAVEDRGGFEVACVGERFYQAADGDPLLGSGAGLLRVRQKLQVVAEPGCRRVGSRLD